jgi:hypothetical protein
LESFALIISSGKKRGELAARSLCGYRLLWFSYTAKDGISLSFADLQESQRRLDCEEPRQLYFETDSDVKKFQAAVVGRFQIRHALCPQSGYLKINILTDAF